MAQWVAAEIGIDLSTTAFSLGVRSDDGSHEDFVSIEVQGGTRWLGQPAFHLEFVPAMFSAALAQLRERGWTFDAGGTLSFSVRQHDMALLGRGGGTLAPALSWQCNAAEAEVAELTQRGVAAQVGKIEPRFILPKLLWTLRQQPWLREALGYVATTGDYITWQLTGQLRLSTSDALSNGLLDQQTKALACQAMVIAGLEPRWFPSPIQSGLPVGLVSPTHHGPDAWSPVRETLHGWTVTAGLGDNHAGAVGCGLADDRTIVISGGSSGTITRMVDPRAALRGQAVQFEFYRHRLLLLMLADCAVWYNRFLRKHREQIDHEAVSRGALQADPARILRTGPGGDDPAGWAGLGWNEKVASTQFSIAVELLLLVQKMLAEVEGGAPVERFALTGGLSQAPLFRGVLAAGLELLRPGATVTVSRRTDRLAFQTATYGALINARMRGDLDRLPETAAKMCPQKPVEPLEGAWKAALDERLRAALRL